ncbi:hypothetical protein DFH08DRAFT_819981 [Mycena albidolilacea]|uniref:Uncharacterized protein n=1 Tax=Mycena albidolilacea TaxID=1033008 RepID=A0AAD6ZE95_9AGAR|nr:hypothetical protein DFH08DRAFT_819981 [Mycena albidolilacea]
MSQQSQQSRNTHISPPDVGNRRDAGGNHRGDFVGGIGYLRDLIELEGEVEAEVAVADANLHTAQDDMAEAMSRHDQVVELRQRFEWGSIHSMDYVNVVDLLCSVESPDADNVPDKMLESGDESEGGEGSQGSEAPEEVGKKRKRKGKSKAAPKKPRVDCEEQDDSSKACDRCKEHLILCILLQGKTACDACHLVHTKCSLQLQSRTRLPQKKASHVAQAFMELGWVGAVVHWPVSQVSSRRCQVDSRTGEIVPEEIPQFEEMQHGLVNTQHHLRELKRNEVEHKRLDEERRRRRQRRREEKAAQAAGTEPEWAGELQRGKGSGRASRPASCSARPARSCSRTGVALLVPVIPVVSPVDDMSLIRMTVKKEEDEEANLAAAMALKNCGLERAVQKLERKEQIAREEAEKKEKEQATIDAEIQKLMAKKAELEAPVEPKKEPVEEMPRFRVHPASTWWMGIW